MRAYRIAVLALAAGCADSCACGEREGPQASSKPPRSAQTTGSAGTPAGALGHARDAGPELQRRPNWTPAPDSKLTRKLAAAKLALETDEVYPKLAERQALSAALGDRLGKLEADAPVSFAVREAGGGKLAVAARGYKLGTKAVRIKVTDTAMLPGARRVVSGRLTLIGNAEVGNEHGVFVRGNPAVTAHFEQQRASRASAMFENRYLVQVMVNDTEDADAALRILEQIDPSKFGR